MKSGREKTKDGFRLRFFIVFFFIAVCVPMYGCASRERVKSPSKNRVDPEKVLFFSMKNMALVYGEHTGVLSPLTGKFFMTGKVDPSAEQALGEMMMNALTNRSSYSVLPSSRAEGARAELLADGQPFLKEKAMMVRLGRTMGADAVVVGGIYRFEARVGNRYSVETPAAVSFEVCLISTADGSVLWSGSYTEKQMALSENLFGLGAFIRRKGWVTAEEMASFALEEMMRTFPE